MSKATVLHDDSKTTLGFWIYLMTDCVVFATLFATFAVLRNNTFGGPDGKEIFSLPYVLTETLILLVSSFTCGLALLAAKRSDARQTMLWFVATFVLGAIFLGMEINEFRNLVIEGYGWRRSAFLSSFFTLVGTHGAHITAGLLWITVMLRQIQTKGLSTHVMRRLTLLGMFWHFLDIVWIFIFTIVFLFGAMPS
jgi:cytochrome o ubiquinol oxidase subunit III